MAEASPIQGSMQGASAGRTAGAASVRRPSEAAHPPAPSTPNVQRDQDDVEVSDVAMYLSKLREIPDIRADLVARVRGEIARGEYDSPAKLSGAMDELMDDLETFG